MCNWPCGRLLIYHHLNTFHLFYCWNVFSPHARGMRFSRTMHLTPPSNHKSQNMLILFNVYSLKIYTLLVNPHFECLLLPCIYSPFNAITLPAPSVHLRKCVLHADWRSTWASVSYNGQQHTQDKWGNVRLFMWRPHAFENASVETEMSKPR